MSVTLRCGRRGRCVCCWRVQDALAERREELRKRLQAEVVERDAQFAKVKVRRGSVWVWPCGLSDRVPLTPLCAPTLFAGEHRRGLG